MALWSLAAAVVGAEDPQSNVSKRYNSERGLVDIIGHGAGCRLTVCIALEEEHAKLYKQRESSKHKGSARMPAVALVLQPELCPERYHEKRAVPKKVKKKGKRCSQLWAAIRSSRSARVPSSVPPLLA